MQHFDELKLRSVDYEKQYYILTNYLIPSKYCKTFHNIAIYNEIIIKH